MSFDAIISISGIAFSAVALAIVLRSYSQSIRSAQPDPELVKRFVETAPLHRLKKTTTP